MKKLFLLSIAAAISFGALAQNKHGNKHKDHKQKTSKNADRDYDDDRDDGDRRDRRYGRYDNDRRDGRYDNDRRDGRYDDGKYSKNLPRKVSDAFYRDYPNATNVNWTKDQGAWTANFRGTGIFGGNKTVSYRANGQRINSNNNRNNPVVNGRSDRRQQGSSNNPVYDKVFGRNQ